MSERAAADGARPTDDASRLDTRQRYRLLEECRETVLERLSHVVTNAMDKMADQLTEEALRAPRADQQRTLLDAVTLVREQRQFIEGGFRRAFGQAFEKRLFPSEEPASVAPTAVDPELLSLVSHEDVSERINLDRRVHRARSRLDPEQVLGIRARLGALLERDWFEESQHPAAPEAVFEALRETVQNVAASASVRNALLDAFEPHLSTNLNDIYSLLNARLVASRVLPRIVQRPTVGRAGGATGSAALRASADARRATASSTDDGDAVTTIGVAELAHLRQQLFENALHRPESRAEAARALADPGMFGVADLPGAPVPSELLASLSVIQGEFAQSGQLPAAAHEETDASLVRALLPMLIDKARQSGSPLDQVIVELVSVVFEYIESDRKLAESLRHQLLRLQVIAVKAALLDRSFFARRQHPMRQLIDRVSVIAADPDMDLDSEAPLVAGIRSVFDRLIEEFDSDVSIFVGAIDAIERLVAEEGARRVAQIEAQLRKAECDEALALAQEKARASVAARLDESTPAFVREFLLKWWTVVIARTVVATQSSTAPASISVLPQSSSGAVSSIASADTDLPDAMDARALRIAEFLIWSVSPKHPEEIGRLAAMVPRLIRAIGDGTQTVQMPQNERDAFMQELMRIHTSTIQAAKQWRGGQPDPRSTGVHLRPDGSVRFSKPRPEGREEPPTLIGNFAALSDWNKGDRVRITSESGAVSDYKLAWVSPARKLYIMSRFPKETLTFSAVELMALIAQERAVRSDETAAVDQALDVMTRVGDPV